MVATLAMAPSMKTRSAPALSARHAAATLLHSTISIGTRAVDAACRNRSWSFCDADSKIARNDNSSSVMRSPPERVLSNSRDRLP
jgi:hypothetical protein